jgi:hypothetical protein
MMGEYTRRLECHRSRFAYWTTIAQIIFYLIPASVAFLGICIYVTAVKHLFLPIYLLGPLLVIIGSVFLDIHVSRRHRQSRALVRFYERGIERLNGEWIGKGNPGTALLDADHSYARDLDIFGEGSLFELLQTVGHTGQFTLARWLSEAAPAEEIRNRQEAVRELRDDLNLWERIAQYGLPVSENRVNEAMHQWSEQRRFSSPLARLTAPLLVLCSLCATAVWWWTGLLFPLVIAGTAQLVFAGHYRDRVREINATTKAVATELETALGVLREVEIAKFSSAKLRELQAKLKVGNTLASSAVEKVIGFATLLKQTESEPFGPFLCFLLWSTQCALATDGWKARYASALQHSLTIVGEFEALCCLAVYTFEHPENTFPEIVRDGTLLEAQGLRHPLVRECVPNAIALRSPVQLIVISGSNMSGKSTLLRTIGTNLILAQAGAPVCASYFRHSPLAIGASLQVLDSLQSGTSRFYAEVRKLNQIMELAETRPTLFLCDEILSGTNSYDRAIGAKAVLRGFITAKAIGLVTTHDLTLTQLADELAPCAVNAHFQDRIDDGRMTFDYRLHDGVVRKSNALELMRAAGLKV